MNPTSPRHDRALILARGDSRRMGRPKGACRFGVDGHSFIECVADLYLARDLPLSIITTPRLRELYALLLGTRPVDWIEFAPGGDTAASVIAALRNAPRDATHLWLHPVDLPRVRPETLDKLRRESESSPRTVLIPACDQQRGHPVVLPLDGAVDWRTLDPTDHPEPMRELLDALHPHQRIIETSDPGVITDYDSPEELKNV